MKTSVACLLVCLGLLVGSCGPQTIEPVPDIPETVSYDTVKIDYGGEDGVDAAQTTGAAITRGQALVGDPSQMAKLTRAAVFGTNRTIYRVFALIDVITRFPARRPRADRWVWEGRPDQNYLYLQIDAVDDATFEYSMRWGNDADDNAEVFHGWFHPFEADASDQQDASAQQDTSAQQGEGVLYLDFDALHTYDPTSAQGRMVIAFRSRHQVRQVRVRFDQFRDATAEALDATYRYVELPDGRGQFVFFGRGDFSKDGSPYEFLSVEAAWLDDHQGRVAARVEEGSVTEPVTVRECWDAAETTVWAQSQPTLPNYDGGSEQQCAAQLRAVNLDAPAYTPPDADPQVPSAHPAE